MYLYLIKYGIAIALVGSVLWMFYNFGYNTAEAHYKLVIAEADEITRVENDRLLKQITEITTKSEANNEIAKAEIVSLSDQLATMLADKRVQHRKVCTKERVPEVSDTEVSVSTADDAELSEEFQRFLLSEFKRADEVRAKFESASAWANDLCKLEVATCD